MPQFNEEQMGQMMEAMGEMDLEKMMQNIPPEMMDMLKQMYETEPQN